MSRAKGRTNRVGEDSWAYLRDYVKKVRRYCKCSQCGKLLRYGILGPDAIPLSLMARMPGMTRAALDLAIKESGWWCRSCFMRGGYRDDGGWDRPPSHDERTPKELAEKFSDDVEARKLEIEILRTKNSEYRER